MTDAATGNDYDAHSPLRREFERVYAELKAIAHRQRAVVAHRQALDLEDGQPGRPRFGVLHGVDLKRAQRGVAHVGQYRNASRVAPERRRRGAVR